MSHPNSCRHWDGLEGMRSNGGGCKAGLDPRKVTGGEMSGWLRRCPCLGANNSGVQCEKRAVFSPEEIEQRAREMDEAFRKAAQALKIVPIIKHDCKPGDSGQRECPECKGVLHFARSSYNGHLRLRCETDGCISMME